MTTEEILTIKELADLFSMSRQAMRKHVDKLDSKYITQNYRGYKAVTFFGVLSLADNLGYDQLSKKLIDDNQKDKKDLEDNDTEVVSKLSLQLADQLAAKDAQIEKLQQLLDQQQQLNLQANQQISLLQSNVTKLELKNSNYEEKLKQKKWWQFWK